MKVVYAIDDFSKRRKIIENMNKAISRGRLVDSSLTGLKKILIPSPKNPLKIKESNSNSNEIYMLLANGIKVRYSLKEHFLTFFGQGEDKVLVENAIYYGGVC